MKKIYIVMMLATINLCFSIETVLSHTQSHTRSNAKSSVGSGANSRVESFMNEKTYLPGGGNVNCVCGQHCSGITVQSCITKCNQNKSCLTNLYTEIRGIRSESSDIIKYVLGFLMMIISEITHGA